jgi:hypothetical protein
MMLDPDGNTIEAVFREAYETSPPIFSIITRSIDPIL